MAKQLILDYTGLEMLRGIEHACDIALNRSRTTGDQPILKVEDLALAFQQLSSLSIPVYSGDDRNYLSVQRAGRYNRAHHERLAHVRKCQLKLDSDARKANVALQAAKLARKSKANRSAIAIAAAERRLRMKRLREGGCRPP